ncbi:amidohydrolase [Tenacibaculum insulae]|uniref:amidohydrolase n=1 Tax=Tenacibaculum insulae TaxID=2029677 RepID=UPI003AB59BB5
MDTHNKLKVALIQSDLIWENPTENRRVFEKKIRELPTNTDLVVLPEMFTTGFTMDAEKNVETMDGKTVNWMRNLAFSKNCAITGSIIVKEPLCNSAKKETYFNRLIFAHPSGKIDFYDKKHLFTLAGEHTVFSAGNEQVLINFKGWKICPLICYDLRFPAWARNTKNYDLLLYVASWPTPRIEAWNTLLKARAIENMSYTIGVNRIGTDANRYKYNGNSVGFDMLGKCLAKNINKEVTLLIELDKENQNKTRNRFRFLEDKDQFTFQ